MAAGLETTPTCEATGLPLPILPVDPEQRDLSLPTDFHHHFHPQRSVELSRKSLGGRALRYSRGQTIERYLHDRYHDFFSGPELPQNPNEHFRLSVLACAGVVPRQAIDLSTYGEYKIVDLSLEQFDDLAGQTSIHTEAEFHPKNGEKRRQEIGKFFAAYALRQDLRTVISDKFIIEQFLDPKTSTEQKAKLGTSILNEASNAAVDDLVPIHKELRRRGYVARHKANKVRKIIGSFFTRDYYPDYFPQIAYALEDSQY